MVIRVLIVDDQPIARAGFAAIIAAEPDMAVVGEAGDGAAAVTAAGEVRPDVVVMDVRMPGLDGLTATRLLTASADPVRVLVLTSFEADEYVFEALRSGASGFLLKDADPADLVTAIRVIASGEGILGPKVTRRLIEAFNHGTATAAVPDSAVLNTLTSRELEVLSLLAKGLSNSEIADSLGIGAGTVKTHVKGVLGKLGARDRIQATIMAFDLGVVRPRTSRRGGGPEPRRGGGPEPGL